MKTTTKNKQQTRANQKKPDHDVQLTFLDHVYELRGRLFWIIATLLVSSAIGFQFKDILVTFIMAPLQGEKLVYLTPGGGFSFIFTLCLYFGALLTIPVVIYHLYRFLQPVMGTPSRKLLSGFLLVSAILALLGAGFGYMVAIPAAIHFLTGFAGEAITANLTAESYLSFVMAYTFGLAVLFQLPLLLVLFDHIRRFPPGTLMSMQRFVIVGAVIAAAIITPTPDIINQMIIAGPIIIVYQLGVAAVWIRHRNKKPVVQHSAPAAAFSPRPAEVQPPMIVASQLETSQPIQPVAAKHRTIDGFVRPASLAATPPTHRAQPLQPRRGARSLDGFSIV